MARIISRGSFEPPVRTTPPKGSWGERYRTGAWTPNSEEIVAEDLVVIQGRIPKDISGLYLRNTENPIFDTLDGNVNYHPFDGDGMLHVLELRNGRAHYRNRWVRTKAFNEEQKAQRSLWAGLLEAMRSNVRSEKPGWGEAIGKKLRLKDSASTDVVVHAGKAVPTWYLCGEAYMVNLDTLETEGVAAWSPKEGISAHCKVDDESGELLFFNYGVGKQGPFFNYGEVDRHQRLTHYQHVPFLTRNVLGMPHDMCFTKNYSILNYFEPEKARFAVVRRGGKSPEVKWFEGSRTYVLHWLNAYEDGEEIVMDGYHMARPEIFTTFDCLDLHQVRPQLWRWHFNLQSGECRERCLDERSLEFGMFNQKYQGRDYRYAYSVCPHHGEFMFTGVTKNDLKTGQSWTYHFGGDIVGSETPVAPKIGGKDEDDAYLVSFLTDVEQDRSVAVLLDAKNIEAAPVCTILLPHRLSSGTHSCWADDANANVMSTPQPHARL